MSVRRGRHLILGTIAPLLLGALALGGVLLAGYVFLVKGYLGGMSDERRQAEDYAQQHIEISVNELRDPGGMWHTIPVALTIYNSGPHDLLKLVVSVTFRDEEDDVVWTDESSHEVRLQSGEEQAVVWKFMIGRLIGSDVERANRIRTVEIEAVRAWTRRLDPTAPGERTPDPARRLSRSSAQS